MPPSKPEQALEIARGEKRPCIRQTETAVGDAHVAPCVGTKRSRLRRVDPVWDHDGLDAALLEVPLPAAPGRYHEVGAFGQPAFECPDEPEDQARKALRDHDLVDLERVVDDADASAPGERPRHDSDAQHRQIHSMDDVGAGGPKTADHTQPDPREEEDLGHASTAPAPDGDPFDPHGAVGRACGQLRRAVPGQDRDVVARSGKRLRDASDADVGVVR